MCVIIYLPAGKTIKDDILLDAWNYNPDGAGLAYVENKKVHVKKGYMKFSDFYDDCIDIISNKGIDRVLHFRFTSRGETNPCQTHPYPLTKNVSSLERLEYATKLPVLMMNGTLNIECNKGLNDTMTWIKKSLYKMPYDKLMARLNNNYCRWAVATPNGVEVTDDFICEDGIYYSNTYFKTYHSRSYKKSKSKKSKSKSKNPKSQLFNDWILDYSDGYFGWYDENHDYGSDSQCRMCFLYGHDCERCFTLDPTYSNEGIDYLSFFDLEEEGY